MGRSAPTPVNTIQRRDLSCDCTVSSCDDRAGEKEGHRRKADGGEKEVSLSHGVTFKTEKEEPAVTCDRSLINECVCVSVVASGRVNMCECACVGGCM